MQAGAAVGLRIPTAQELSGGDGGGGGTVLVLRQNFEAPPCYYIRIHAFAQLEALSCVGWIR